jgi:hypothetical protein
MGENIKMDVKETGCDIVNFMHFAQDRGQWWALVSTVLNLWVP